MNKVILTPAQEAACKVISTVELILRAVTDTRVTVAISATDKLYGVEVETRDLIKLLCKAQHVKILQTPTAWTVIELK